MSYKHDTINRLHGFLNDAPLIPQDKYLVSSIISRLKSSRWTVKDQTAANALLSLFDYDVSSRYKISQRINTTKVDLFHDLLNRFSKTEIVAITKEVRNLQLTDGCTVGCPWCCFSSNPRIQKSFSFASLKRFFSLYRDYFPKRFLLYHSSDPFDWVDGRYSYVELIQYLRHIVPDTDIRHSTAVPIGTELTIVRFLLWAESIGIFDSIKQLPHTASATEVFDPLAYSCDHPPKNKIRQTILDKAIIYHRSRRHHFIRFSKTRNNQHRIGFIFTLLRYLGFQESNFNMISVENRDTGQENDSIILMGRQITSKLRDKIADCVGPNCYDGVLMTPSSVNSIITTGVTKKFNGGIQSWEIKPGNFRIPKSQYVWQYSVRNNAALLPPPTIYHFIGGQLVNKTREISLVRDIAAYGYILLKELPVVKIYQASFNQTYWKNFLKQLKVNYLKRKKITLQLIKNQENDEEEISIAKTLLSRLDDWIATNGI